MNNTKENLNQLHCPQIWIADAMQSDYENLNWTTLREKLNIQFFATAGLLLHAWRLGQPDVCLINIELPDFSGLDLVEMIRPFPEGTTVGLVAESFDPQTEIRALTLGVHCCLCKPLVIDVLRACLHKPSFCVHKDQLEISATIVRLQPADKLNDPVCCDLKRSERRWLNSTVCSTIGCIYGAF